MASLSETYLSKLSQKDRENLFKLIDYKDTNRVLQSKENSTPAKEPLAERSENIHRKLEEIEVIKKMKLDLQKEMEESKSLRENLLFIQEKYKEQNETLSAENGDLKLLAQKLTSDFESLVYENSELTRQITFAGKKSNDNESKTAEMHKNLENVRELVKVFLSEGNTRKIKDIKERNFWQSIASEKLIHNSEPPTEYPFPEKLRPNDKIITKAEFDRVMIELRKAQEEVKKVQSFAISVEEDNIRLREKLTASQKEKQDEIVRMIQQQRGMARRINYLVEEKEKLESDAKERDVYISKLELKLVQQEMNIKGLRSRVHTAAKTQNPLSHLPTTTFTNRNQEPTTNKRAASYSRQHANRQKLNSGPTSSRKNLVADISAHSYAGTKNPNCVEAPSWGQPDVNMNLSNVFQNIRGSYANSKHMIDGHTTDEEKREDQFTMEDLNKEEMNSSLLNDLLQSAKPESNSEVKLMKNRIHNLEGDLGDNRRDLAEDTLRKNIEYIFEDDDNELEFARSEAPHCNPGSEYYDAEDRSGNNKSSKSH